MKIKKGRDIKLSWEIYRKDGTPENLIDLNFKFFAYPKANSCVKIFPQYILRDGHVLDFIIKYDQITSSGEYVLCLIYQIPNQSYPSGIQREEFDNINAFTIVDHSLQEDLDGAILTSQVDYVRDGKSAAQIWRDLNLGTGSDEDFMNWLRDPAVVAAAAAQEVADHPTYIGQDHYVYIYNKQTQSYNKTDIYCKGDAFSVKKTYPSINAMNADFSGTDTKTGDFVLIETGNVEDPDNSKLFVKTESAWSFLTDFSGAIGFTGKTPQLSIGTVTTGDAGSYAVITISEDGVDASGNPKYKLNFAIPKGDKGDKGDVEYATFYIDHITGCLKMIYDPSFNNVSFSVKNGNLILEINTL